MLLSEYCARVKKAREQLRLYDYNILIYKYIVA